MRADYGSTSFANHNKKNTTNDKIVSRVLGLSDTFSDYILGFLNIDIMTIKLIY